MSGRIYCIVSIILFCVPALAGENNAVYAEESQKIQNLRAFAKLYGYVRFFHPSDEASSIDWDKFAVYGAEQVKEAKNRQELKQALESLFLPIAPTIQIYGNDEEPRDYSKSLPANTAGLKVVAWQHLGVRLYGWQGYKSLRLNSENKLPPNSRGRVYQVLSSEDLERCKGRNIVLRAMIRTDLGSSEGWASLSINIKTKELEIIDLLMDNRLTGMTPWTPCELKCKVPENTRRVHIGIILSGKGQIWADEIAISIVNDGDEEQSIVLPNAGFEQTDDNSDRPTQWLCPEESRYGHRTDNVKPYSGKRSLLIKPLWELFEERPKITDTIIKPLDSGLTCQVPLALYRDEQGTLGENDRYPYSRLSEQLERMDPNAFTADDENVRLADVVMTWNVFQHFYPYFDVVKVDWDTELTNTLQRALMDKNVDQFYDTLWLFVAKLQDGHGVIRRQPGPSIPRRGLPSGIARGFFPFAVDWIDNQLVVTVSKDPTKVQRGDIIMSVDGVNAEQKLLDIERYICGSPQLRRYESLLFFTGGSKEKAANLTIKREGKIIQVQMERSRRRWVREEQSTVASIEEIQDDIFYVDLRRAKMVQIEERIHELATAKGVIFDLRGHPTDEEILCHLMRQKSTSENWMRIPKVIYPDREKPAGYDYCGWNIQPKEPRIEGKVVFLTNARAVSYAESVMGYVEHYKLGEIVGQPTAGTDGNVNPFRLPGGFTISWTGMKVVKHDGSQQHHIGILPTVPVQRTIRGVVEGRDEYLEKALEIINQHTMSTKEATEHTLGHDVAITKVSAPAICVQAETVSIVATLDNQGVAKEACDAILVDASNGTEIARQSVTIHYSRRHAGSEVDLFFYGEPGRDNYFGDYIAVGGDVNGDGFNDVLMSSAGYPNSGPKGKGKAYLFYGGSDMDAVPDKIFTGEKIGDLFSDGIHSIADLNDDGYADLLIGATEYQNTGRLYIFYGGKDMDTVADIVIDCPNENDHYFGYKPSVGDVNGDGYPDLCVTSLKYNNGIGRVYLYYGPIASDTTVDKVFTGENPGDWFGQSVVADGDIDNDGYDDLCIVSRKYPNDEGRGRVYLYWGASGTSMDEVYDLTFTGVTGERRSDLGCGIDVFDIDNDHFADLIIGSQQLKEGAWLYWGAPRSEFNNSADITFIGEKQSDNFGNYISVGNFDGDQNPDIIINAWYYGGALGRSYLYSGGSQTSMDNFSDHSFTGEFPHWGLGQIHLVDVNSDGYADVLGNSGFYNDKQGRAVLWYGRFGKSIDITFTWDTTNASIGKHTLKVEIPPVPGEQNTEDNIKTVTIEVRAPTK